LKVGVLKAAGHSQTEIARRIGASPTELRRAYERLDRVAPTLDRDDDL
jgi:DNA-binding Lrp family transcriptional regulator